MADPDLSLVIAALMDCHAATRHRYHLESGARALAMTRLFFAGRFVPFREGLERPLRTDFPIRELVALRERIGADFGEIKAMAHPRVAERVDGSRLYLVSATPVRGERVYFHFVLSLGPRHLIQGLWIQPSPARIPF